MPKVSWPHSGFCDLIINGLVGIRPQADADELEVHPLLPEQTWDYFCLAGVPYHGRELTLLWDRDGNHYRQGQGFRIWCDGVGVWSRPELSVMRLKLPPMRSI